MKTQFDLSPPSYISFSKTQILKRLPIALIVLLGPWLDDALVSIKSATWLLERQFQFQKERRKLLIVLLATNRQNYIALHTIINSSVNLYFFEKF